MKSQTLPGQVKHLLKQHWNWSTPQHVLIRIAFLNVKNHPYLQVSLVLSPDGSWRLLSTKMAHTMSKETNMLSPVQQHTLVRDSEFQAELPSASSAIPHPAGTGSAQAADTGRGFLAAALILQTVGIWWSSLWRRIWQIFITAGWEALEERQMEVCWYCTWVKITRWHQPNYSRRKRQISMLTRVGKK